MSIGDANRASATACDNPNSWVTYEINMLKSDYQVPTVVASGNDDFANKISWPACISNAVSVGNTTVTYDGSHGGPLGADAVFGFVDGGSNTAPNLDLVAPGTDICSAVPETLDNDGSKDGWECGWIGTSMAAPHVAGALAIIAQKWPTATVDQMLKALQRSGSNGGVAVTDSRNASVTRTRINVANVMYWGL
jgi:subtilisin family serine protease